MSTIASEISYYVKEKALSDMRSALKEAAKARMEALGKDPQFRGRLFSIFAYDAATGYRFGVGFGIKKAMRSWSKSQRSSSRAIGTAISSAIAKVDGGGGVQALNAVVQMGDFMLHLNEAVQYYDNFIAQLKSVVEQIQVKSIQDVLRQFSGASQEAVQDFLDAGNELYGDGAKYPSTKKYYLVRLTPSPQLYPYLPAGEAQGILLGKDAYMCVLMCGTASLKMPLQQARSHRLVVTALEVFDRIHGFYAKNENPPLEDLAMMMQGNLEECISVGVAQCGADLMARGLGVLIETGGKAFLDEIRRGDMEAREARGDALTSSEVADLWELRQGEYGHLMRRVREGESMTPAQQARIDAHAQRIEVKERHEQQQRYLLMGRGRLHEVHSGGVGISIIDEDGNLKSGPQNPFTDPTSVFYARGGEFEGVSAIFGDRVHRSFAGFVEVDNFVPPHASHPQTVVMSEDGEICIVDLDPGLKSAATSMEVPHLTPNPERGVVDPRVLAAEYEALSQHAKRAQKDAQDILIAHGILDEAGMVKLGAEFGAAAMGEPEARTGLVADADRAIAAKLALGGEYVRDAAVFLSELAKDYPKIAGTIEGALIVWSWVDPISWALWAFDESGAKELSQGSLRDMFHKMGLHESAAGLSAVCIGMAEVYASKGKGLKSGAAAETKAGLHEVLDVIKMETGYGFRSVSGKFHETPVTWTAPVGTQQTYRFFQRTDIDWNIVRTSGPRDFIGKTNLEAARAGLAPQLSDGNFVRLHHCGQSSKGPIVEVIEDIHKFKSAKLANGKTKFDIIHGQHGVKTKNPDFPVNHSVWSKEQIAYWKHRAGEAK